MAADIDWDLALSVCLYGQLAVFFVLTLLMIIVYATSAMIKKLMNTN